MKELLSNFFSTTNERIKNPFIGSFIFAWIACNWKGWIYFLWSDDTIEDKIKFVQIYYTSIWTLLIIPLAIAVFYVAVFPYLMMILERLPTKAIRRRKDNANEEHMEDIVRKIKRVKREKELEDSKAAGRDIAGLNDEIDLLKNQLTERDTRIKMLNTELQNANNQLKRLELEIRSKLDEEERWNPKQGEADYIYMQELNSSELKQLLSRIDTDSSKDLEKALPNIIKHLGKRRFIEKDQSDRYFFTTAGRRFLQQYENLDEFR